jgi:hypothetical protein
MPHAAERTGQERQGGALLAGPGTAEGAAALIAEAPNEGGMVPTIA